MRLQLIVVAVGLTTASLARAQVEGDHATVSARTSAYVDDDATVISTSAIAVRGEPTEELTLAGRYIADVVSSASIDVVTAATGRWDEVRSEGMAGATWADGTTTLSAGYVFSHEEDWDSHTVELGASRDFLVHNLTLGLGVSVIDNAVGRADDPRFAESLRVGGGGVRATWLGGTRDLYSAGYDIARLDGYQASPYRFAFVADPSGVPLGFVEDVPVLRTRHAVTLRWNHHLVRDAAIRSHLRAYADDWGVLSVTGGTELAIGHDAFELAGNVRGYAQRGATFYQDVYDEPRRYMTADRELSSFQDVFAGVTGRWTSETIAVDASLTGFGFWFPEFSRLPTRRGVIAGLGVVVAL